MSDKEVYDMGFDTVDDFSEYLILKLKNGELSIFRNSYVELFRDLNRY